MLFYGMCVARVAREVQTCRFALFWHGIGCYVFILVILQICRIHSIIRNKPVALKQNVMFLLLLLFCR